MLALSWLDTLGYLAGALTLAAFAQTSMLTMRVTAVAANLCFIAYGLDGGFAPIVTLHGLLLPINLVRLYGLCAIASAPESAPPNGAALATLAQATSDPGACLLWNASEPPPPRASW